MLLDGRVARLVFVADTLKDSQVADLCEMQRVSRRIERLDDADIVRSDTPRTVETAWVMTTSVILSAGTPARATASLGGTKSRGFHRVTKFSRWNPASTSTFRPSLPLSSQTIIAMSSRRDVSAPSIRPDIRKAGSVP